MTRGWFPSFRLVPFDFRLSFPPDPPRKSTASSVKSLPLIAPLISWSELYGLTEDEVRIVEGGS